MATFLSNDAIDSYYKGMKEPVNAEIEQAGNDYQAALQRLQQMKEEQDAQNYRSYVRQQAEIPGLMRASGNNGGMVDSAIASLANAYNQARANRSLEYENNRANQDLDYNNRLAELRAKLTQYDQMAAADRANLLAQQEAEAAAAAAYRRASGGGGYYGGGASSSSTPAYKTTTNDAFYQDYLTNSGKAAQDEAARQIKLYDAGATDIVSKQNAIANKITPSTGVPKASTAKQIQSKAKTWTKENINDLLRANREVDPLMW